MCETQEGCVPLDKPLKLTAAVVALHLTPLVVVQSGRPQLSGHPIGGGSRLLEGPMRILKILGGIVVALLLCVACAFVAARFLDGPLAIIPGGPLSSGELVSGPVPDWNFAESVPTIELQLAEDRTSRTTWILVSDGRAFIPCSLGFPPGKHWHLRADQDGRAIIRLLGRRYPVTLKRLNNSTLEPKLKAMVSSKYGRDLPSDAGVWFFAVESRAS